MFTLLRILNPVLLSRVGKASIQFNPGVNLVVGRNGCGKSSMFEAIRNELEHGTGQNARLSRDPTVPHLWYSGSLATADAAVSLRGSEGSTLSAGHASHGELLQRHLQALTNIEGEAVVLMDEPDIGLDFFAIAELAKTIVAKSDTVQFIVATHSPLLMTMTKNVNFICLDRQTDKYQQEVLKLMAKRIRA